MGKTHGVTQYRLVTGWVKNPRGDTVVTRHRVGKNPRGDTVPVRHRVGKKPTG